MYTHPSKYNIEKNFITQEQYEEIKKNYLCKNETNTVLFKRYYEKYEIEKEVFLEVLDKIRQEEGLDNSLSNKKIKRIYNPYSFHDKHPNSYKVQGVYNSEHKNVKKSNKSKKGKINPVMLN